jgi:dTDP-4-amino-4,6-dideoxygalactose transaminase
VLRVKLPHLDRWNARRQELAGIYREELAGLPLGLPAAEAGGRHVYHLFVAETERRDGLRQALSSAGIETGIHYPVPVHLQPVLAGLGYRRGVFPNAERLAATSLSLPMYPELTVAEIKRVAAATRFYFQS